MKITSAKYLIVEPHKTLAYSSVRISEDEYLRLCKDVKEAIERHVDHFGNVYIATEQICSYCKYLWETEDSGEPVCCEKAQEEFKKQKAKLTHA